VVRSHSGDLLESDAVPRSEKIGYAIAVAILVIGGAFFRTVILNWISGPAIVVASVVLSTRYLSRFDPPATDSPATGPDVAPSPGDSA